MVIYVNDLLTASNPLVLLKSVNDVLYDCVYMRDLGLVHHNCINIQIQWDFLAGWIWLN